MNHDENKPALPALQLDQATRDSIDRARAAIEEERRVQDALRRAKKDRSEAEVKAVATQSDLTAKEAAAALAGTDIDKAARKAFTAARDEVAFVEARVSGLERRAAETSGAAIRAMQEVAVNFKRWCSKQVEIFTDTIFRPAQQEYLGTLRLANALAIGLSAHRLGAVARAAFVCDPDDPMRNLANPKRKPWQDDPVADEVYKQILAIRAEVQPYIAHFAETNPTISREGESDAA